MERPGSSFSELLGAFKSWVLRCSERQESRDFWMPDDSCRVCYDCDARFTLFNRKHHCRLCGRIFCSRCSTNSVPATALGHKRPEADRERIRVCSYCYKQWHQEVEASAMAAALARSQNARCSTPGLSPSLSETSLASSRTSCTGKSCSTIALLYSNTSFRLFAAENDEQDARRMDFDPYEGSPSSIPYAYCLSRSDDEDDDYGASHSDAEGQHFRQSNTYYDDEFDEVDCDQAAKGKTDEKEFPSLADEGIERKSFNIMGGQVEVELDSIYDCDTEPVDIENNGILWFPPSPENEEDEKDSFILNEEEDDMAAGFGYLRTSGSFNSAESSGRERMIEEERKSRNVLGYLKSLVSHLLQIENLPESKEDDEDSWLEIVTSLSWEVASLVKPDTSRGGMDPGGYVKVKCIASGRRSESSVIKGVVCRKNLAHRRMKSRIENSRLLILGGALEYQRVSNLLSSFDTLRQQEMDHLKMAVAKIDAHHPNVLLVEKAVSRYAQDFLLGKDISLVLNIKRSLLERIARCTGAQIVPSIDHLSPQQLGYCDLFHVQKFIEEHDITATGGTVPTKTLIFFEGCPKPLGCTVLLRGANKDELKRVKHVVQYALFAAYHLALETSFLADEGASLLELSLGSPITVVLPEKASVSAIGKSISSVSGFTVSRTNVMQDVNSMEVSDDNEVSQFSSGLDSSHTMKLSIEPGVFYKNSFLSSSFTPACPPGNMSDYISASYSAWKKHQKDMLTYSKEMHLGIGLNYSALCSSSRNKKSEMGIKNPFWEIKTSEAMSGRRPVTVRKVCSSDFGQHYQDNYDSNANQEEEISTDDFPPSLSDCQSILVSLSTRCVWKGTVCERARLFRIQYYGNFDNPLGKFLKDHLFNQGYCCRSCEMPVEAHLHCYTHRQGSLIIYVKKISDFLLPGERDGKIWMWHRCLRCPHREGIPPVTRRVIMSDAAWGLSFGKFLELSFSNHAAASRVASCGHSLHRDCLRFYGFGGMVACFRYASIDVNSVYLPPAQLEFNIHNTEWIQEEADKVAEKVDLLFKEVLDGIDQVSEKISSLQSDSHLKVPDSKFCSVSLKGIWQNEKAEFEESLHKLSDNSWKRGQLDIIEINKLHRKLLFHAYLWDRRLCFSAGFENYNGRLENMVANEEKLPSLEEHGETNSLLKPENAQRNIDSSLADTKNETMHKENTLPAKLEDVPAQSNLVSLNRLEGGHPDDSTIGESQLLDTMSDNLDGPLHPGHVFQRELSDGEAALVQTLLDNLDAKWTHEDGNVPDMAVSDTIDSADDENIVPEAPESVDACCKLGHLQSFSGFPTGVEGKRDLSRWVEMPFSDFYSAINKGYAGDTPLFHILHEYNPVYISSFREFDMQNGARVLLPLGIDEIFVPIFDEEPGSIICHALVSLDYHSQFSEERDGAKDGYDPSSSFTTSDSGSSNPFVSFDDIISESIRDVGSGDDQMLSMLASSGIQSDPTPHTNLHIKVSFSDASSSDKTWYTVTCYYAKYFQSLRRICCPFELDFIKSLSRCKKWGAQGGKSNAFFAKSLDDRFVIKQVTKTELESFIQFAPEYFNYLFDMIRNRTPTCLAKILGIYQVSVKHSKAGKESKIDVLVMENLLYGRNISRLYDLKGSSRSRYNADSSGNNKVLLDQNLIEAMPKCPIFVSSKAKRLLERAVWNDTSFLGNVDVMDYSLLVGVDQQKHELVLGIIDFMRQYTWDKHLETWVKASGILGGPKNSDPTVISPVQYKRRFRKAMTAYFRMVPEQRPAPSLEPSRSQSDLGEEELQ